MNLKQLGFSLLVTALLGVIVWQGITPFIHRANRKIIERYERVFPNLKPDKSPSSPHKKKYFYLFHEPEDAWYNNLFTLCIVIFTLSRIYHLYLRKEEVERNFEKLQSESLQSQLDALHNQINPHFFFNALNSLHALIAEGQNQKSLSYLSNLSNVFRYILQSEKKGLVSLQEELAFLETYRFMLSVKYEEKLQFYIDITPTYTGYLLPVLSILPLVENVIKHNEISARNPMTLSILSTDEPSLVIQNRKQAKLDEVDKVGIGLKNLNNRFLLLIHKEIRIEDTPDYFRVTLPLQTPKTTKQA